MEDLHIPTANRPRPILLIFFEKRFLRERFFAAIDRCETAKQWYRQYDAGDFDLQTFGLWRFSYPERLTAKDFPYIGSPRYRFAGTRSHKKYTPSPEAQQKIIAELIQRAAVILRLGDSDYRGYRVFDLALNDGTSQFGQESVDITGSQKVYDPILHDLSDNTMDHLVHELMNSTLPIWPANSARLAAGAAKDYFDYNWAINNRALMAQYLRAAGATQTQLIDTFQKVSLTLLLFLARDKQTRDQAMNGKHWSENILLSKMQNWNGYESYKSAIIDGLGSPASRVQALTNLYDIGLAKREKRAVILTDTGKDLARLLPKDAYDPHQSRRLSQWMSSWPASEPAMARYLGTYWSKIRNRAALL